MKTIHLFFIWTLFVCQLSIFASDNTIDSTCSEGTNLSLIGTIVDFSTEENTTNTVENIIDDSTNNRWAAKGFPQFATIDLGDNYNVNEINLATFEDRGYQFIVEGSISSATSGFYTLVDASNNTDEGTINETFSAETVRYVKLTITGANSYSGEWSSISQFEIICAGITDGTDRLTVSSIDDFEADGGSQSVTVNSNIDWTVSESSSWISLNTTSGSDNGSFTITTNDNTSANDRSASVIVSGNDITRSITVSQKGTSVTNTDLDLNSPPSENFNLTNWNLNVPIDRDDDSGISTNIERTALNEGYELKDVGGRDYFYTSADGGMVFRNYPKGAPKTSPNTSYSRTELREILNDNETAGASENNWYFSSSEDIPSDAGGVDGVLTATLAVNQVTTDGNSNHKGRVIVGQIHASNNEPCRLYYHKLPEHTNGAIYVVHEDFGGEDTWYNIIGNYIEDGSNSGDLNEDIEESSDGVQLDEQFSYKIEVIGNDQWVTIYRPGKADITKYIDMADSGYEDDYMYFKAGVYSQNNTTDIEDDYDQATFYALSQSHNGTITNPTESLTVSSIDDFDADGGSQSVTVNSNIDWTVSENSSWISLNTTSGSDNGSFTITTNENTTTNDRSATVTVSGNDITRSVTVTQLAKDSSEDYSGRFDLEDFDIETSWLTGEDSTTTESFDALSTDNKDWYDKVGDTYWLKSLQTDGNRTEWKETQGKESSLFTYKNMKYKAIVEDIPENGVNIAQVHNRGGANRPLLRVYIDSDQYIKIKVTTSDPSDSSSSYDDFDGPYYTEGTDVTVQILTKDGKVSINIETTDGSLSKTITPTNDWDDFSESYYLKAGVYTEGNDKRPQITFDYFIVDKDNTLSSDEFNIDLLNNISVYPNPFTDTIKIDFHEKTSVPIVKINVCDVLGRVVLNVDKDAQNELTEIDGNFSSGFYFIQLLDINGNVVAVKKVVKE